MARQSEKPSSNDPGKHRRIDAEKILAAFMLTHNQKRERFFPKDILEYPMWCILQFLYINDGVTYNLDEAAIFNGTRIDSATGRRYLNALVKRAYVEQLGDDMFNSGRHYQLSTSAKDKMTMWLDGVLRKIPEFE